MSLTTCWLWHAMLSGRADAAHLGTGVVVLPTHCCPKHHLTCCGRHPAPLFPLKQSDHMQTYGPGGANPLLPGPQDNSQVSLGIDAVESANPRSQSYIALAVRSPAGAAVDVSGWKVTAGSATWSFPAGAECGLVRGGGGAVGSTVFLSPLPAAIEQSQVHSHSHHPARLRVSSQPRTHCQPV